MYNHVYESIVGLGTELFPFNSHSWMGCWSLFCKLKWTWTELSSFLTKWTWTQCSFLFLFWTLQYILGNFLKKRSKIFLINVVWAFIWLKPKFFIKNVGCIKFFDNLPELEMNWTFSVQFPFSSWTWTEHRSHFVKGMWSELRSPKKERAMLWPSRHLLDLPPPIGSYVVYGWSLSQKNLSNIIK